MAPASPLGPCRGLQLQELGLYRPPLRRDPAGGGLEPVDWDAGIRGAWDVSEAAALKLLDGFFAPRGGLERYEAGRQYADGRAVSRLSPYLHSGLLSARLVWQRMRQAQ